ncbi:MAG: hypothetical protein ABI461_13950 [Polyangiaceae bacterium]
MLEPNPYAPTTVTLETRVSEQPLPPGVRRFRLDEARHTKLQRIGLVQLLVFILPFLIFFIGVVAWITHMPLTSFIALVVISIGWAVVQRVVRIRLAKKSQLASYELLVSENAARRNLAGFISAELLRPEIATMTEVPTGIWIACETPPQALFIANALADYDDARALFSTWGPIRKIGGFAALRLARKLSPLQGPRENTFGTALANNDALATELTMLRHVSTTAGRDRPPSRSAALLRAMAIWFGLMIFFLAIWQYFSVPR